jgi:hypothetical protein
LHVIQILLEPFKNSKVQLNSLESQLSNEPQVTKDYQVVAEIQAKLRNLFASTKKNQLFSLFLLHFARICREQV